ncbi:hypothetical protein WPS_21800 [Vulcanimicrobium alpinum]|uniref:4-oxalocrotonate tautomerase-like domain-containing protein n=2 Tax=Vulcanimicrobium alpinum TaxID=3016050 RepID=A0AAN1XX06_UNVUL|nr:hypothetical protein WPS_21800 [Vulcanimicrobium alpinum]
MPFVRILHARNALSVEQKERMLQSVLDAVVSIEGEGMRTGVGVAIEEALASRDDARNCLPWVTITLIRDAQPPDARRRMIERVTEAIVAVEGEARRAQVWVGLEESIASGEWGIGGRMLTLEAMRRFKAGGNPWPEDAR